MVPEPLPAAPGFAEAPGAGLGLAVTAWEIHGAHGSQVSQLRNEHEAFLLASGQTSPQWAFWVSIGYICSGALVCGEGYLWAKMILRGGFRCGCPLGEGALKEQ